MFKMISPGNFLIFFNVDFLGCYRGKEQNVAQNEKLSVTHHISGTVQHMIMVNQSINQSEFIYDKRNKYSQF